MTRTKKPGRKTKCPNENVFNTLYYQENMSASEIAKIYGVQTQCVYNWAAKFKKVSNKEDRKNEINLPDKQIFPCLNYNKRKERSKINEQRNRIKIRSSS